jgi:hypothetical protein
MSFSEIGNGWFIYAVLSLPVKMSLTGNDRKKISLLPLLPLLTFTRHFWVDRLLYIALQFTIFLLEISSVTCWIDSGL